MVGDNGSKTMLKSCDKKIANLSWTSDSHPQNKPKLLKMARKISNKNSSQQRLV